MAERAPLSPRTEADLLAADLPGLLLEAQRLAAFAPGVHGRRRAGQGEAFWQFRDHRPEDGARLVDWRRSARGDRFYVREREREAAQSALFWVDPDPGFAWASGPSFPTKRARAAALALAFAILCVRGGERVGVLGQAPRGGPRAVERLALALTSPAAGEPAPPPTRTISLFFSDFYAPIELWRSRLKSAAAAGATGALVVVTDPAEEDFPYEGRVRFERPGLRDVVLLGRAQAAKELYRERLAEHWRALRALGAEFGFILQHHRTDRPAAPILSNLVFALEERR